MEVSYFSTIIQQHDQLIDFICKKADRFSIVFPIGYRYLQESKAREWLAENDEDDFLSDRIQNKLQDQVAFHVDGDYIFKSDYYKGLERSLIDGKAVLDGGSNLRYTYTFTLDENSIAWLKKMKNINQLRSDDFCVTPHVYTFKSIRFFNGDRLILGTNLFYDFLYLECGKGLISKEDIAYLQTVCRSYKNPLTEFIREYYEKRDRDDLTEYFAQSNYENMVFIPNAYYGSDRNLNAQDFRRYQADLEDSKLRKQFFHERDNHIFCLNILKRRKGKLKLDEIYEILQYSQTASSCHETVLELLKELPEDKVLNAFFTMLLGSSLNEERCESLILLFQDLGLALERIEDNALKSLFENIIATVQRPDYDAGTIRALELAKKEFCKRYEKNLIVSQENGCAGTKERK